MRVRILLAVVVLSAVTLPMVQGCSGGNTTSDLSPPLIVAVNGGITTTPSPLKQPGGSAAAVVDVTDASGVNPDSVKIDVIRQNGISLIGGPQPMISFSSAQNRWGYQFTLPANANNFSADVYRVTVTARDGRGNSVNPAFLLGTVIVPNV